MQAAIATDLQEAGEVVLSTTAFAGSGGVARRDRKSPQAREDVDRLFWAAGCTRGKMSGCLIGRRSARNLNGNL
jgi:hypothetical protein